MGNSSKPDGVDRILDVVKRVLDAVLPGPPRIPTRTPQRRTPIPPTPPPRLLRTPASPPPRPRPTYEPQQAGKKASTSARETGAPVSPSPAPEPGVPPESVAGLAESERPQSGTEPPYEQMTKAELYTLAQQLDVPGRSTMNKRQLIEALRRR